MCNLLCPIFKYGKLLAKKNPRNHVSADVNVYFAGLEQPYFTGENDFPFQSQILIINRRKLLSSVCLIMRDEYK